MPPWDPQGQAMGVSLPWLRGAVQDGGTHQAPRG